MTWSDSRVTEPLARKRSGRSGATSQRKGSSTPRLKRPVCGTVRRAIHALSPADGRVGSATRSQSSSETSNRTGCGLCQSGFANLTVGVEIRRSCGTCANLERCVSAERLLVGAEADAPGLRGLHPIAFLGNRELARAFGHALGPRGVLVDVELDLGVAARPGLRTQDQVREAHALHRRSIDVEPLLGLESPALFRRVVEAVRCGPRSRAREQRASEQECASHRRPSLALPDPRFKPPQSCVTVCAMAEHDGAHPDYGENALIARLQASDAGAFSELVRAQGPRMLAVARRLLRSEDDAADAVQEAFISAFRAIGNFEGGARLSTWLHRIVVNAALMRLRNRARRPEVSIEELLPRFVEDGQYSDEPREWKAAEPLSALERRETRALVRGLIDELPSDYRTVLLLRDIEGLDTKETAEFLGVTPNAAKIRLHRARLALRGLLDPHMRARGVP